MFNGVPDHFHHFIASRASLPIPPSFPLHGTSLPGAAPAFASFDPYPSHQTLQPIAEHHQSLHQLHHQLATSKDEKKEEQSCSLVATNLVAERERSIQEPTDPWSNDEVLTLLRIRSTLESWFPDFTWEHVSRKLAEVGFKRSAEKCKEKFEEESRHFNNLNYNKSYRFFTELDEVYQGENAQVSAEKNQNMEKENEDKEEEQTGQSMEEDSGKVVITNIPSKENEVVKKPDKSKKRKRKYKFEMLKGYCEAIVNKIMAQQEELHKKLIEDMLKRDEEMLAREEAWKNQEMDRLNKEIEIRAKEQAIAKDRQAMLIDFLKKFTSASSQDQHLAKKIEELLKVANSSSSKSSPSEILPQNLNATSKVSSTQNKLEIATTSSSMLVSHQNPSSLPTQKKNPNAPSPSSSETLSPQNPSYLQPTNLPYETSSSTLSMSTQNPNSTKMHENPLAHTPSSSYKASTERDKDVGKRWPKGEVLALINLRCSLTNNNNGNDDKEGAKGPLWERISQGMQQMGYKRSAKRCKEKWENINKYFRKTKDNNNKKRSLDARTCPYFHQLSSLYSQGILVAPTDVPENHRALSKNASVSSQNVSNDGVIHVAEDGKSTN